MPTAGRITGIDDGFAAVQNRLVRRLGLLCLLSAMVAVACCVAVGIGTTKSARQTASNHTRSQLATHHHGTTGQTERPQDSGRMVAVEGSAAPADSIAATEPIALMVQPTARLPHALARHALPRAHDPHYLHPYSLLI